MKGIIMLPLIASLTACGFSTGAVNDYTTVYPTTAGCCNSVVVNQPCCKRVTVKPVVVRPVVRSCCAKSVNRVVSNPCCSSYVQTGSVYDSLTMVNAYPVDVTTIGYDYY